MPDRTSLNPVQTVWPIRPKSQHHDKEQGQTAARGRKTDRDPKSEPAAEQEGTPGEYIDDYA